MRTVQRVARTTISVEAYSGVDGQGKPTYGSSTAISGRAVHKTELIRMPDGSDVRTTLLVWVDAGEDVQPAERDRLTVDSVPYIVVAVDSPQTLKGVVDHTKARCREE